MDFVKRAIKYAKAAQKSKKHGKWSRLACKRFLNDLKSAKKKSCSFYFSKDWANYVCGFVETLHHVEGSWETPTLKLHDSMVWFYVNLYGFRRKDTKGRRFTTALWASGRKNSKSTGLGAPIGLFSQFEEDEPGAQVVSAATTGDQAQIVWSVAKRMIEKNKDFRDHYSAHPYARTIAGFGNGSVFKYISSKASTQDGLNPSCAIIDEVHAHPNHDLINVLKSAAGGRQNPLYLFVTTEGYDQSDSPWKEIRKLSHQILEGIVEADHFLAVIFSVDEDDDPFDADIWVKANPLMEVNPILSREIEKEALEAEHMPAKMAEFRTKRLNLPSESAEAVVNLQLWKKQPDLLSLDQLEGHPCWFSLDLSATRDLCSWRGLWWVDGVFHTHGWRFLPKNGVHQLNNSGTHKYISWIEQGLIIETLGKTVNQDSVQQVIEDCHRRFQPLGICSDEWNARELIRKLDEKGIDVDIFIQGPRSYHPAIKKFEELYLNGKLAHGNDPVLNWCASNMVYRYDANMNAAPDKKKSANKIDDVVTLIMTCGLAAEFKPRRTVDDVLNNMVSIRL